MAFADAIALMHFPVSFATEIADRWQRTWPNMQRELLDGTVIVPDFVVAGMFRFYADCGAPTVEAVGQEYTAVAANLFCRLHGHLSAPEFKTAVRLAGLRNMPTEGLSMPTSRAVQTFPDLEATQTAVMAWLEMVIGCTPDGATIRPVNGQDDDDRRFSLYVWCDHDLIGAAIGTEVFRGGDWLLTTYDIEAVDG